MSEPDDLRAAIFGPIRAYGSSETDHDTGDPNAPWDVSDDETFLYGGSFAVSDELDEHYARMREAFELSMLPDDGLTAWHLAERNAARVREREEHAEKVALHADLNAYASSVGGPLEAAIRHHLPDVPAGESSKYYDWPCPGCDGGHDEGGYFPCSTIDAIQDAREIAERAPPSREG